MQGYRLGALLLVVSVLLATRSLGSDDPPGPPKADASKNDKDAKPAKDEVEYNRPPKGAVVAPLGQITGRIAKGSDGKTFSVESSVNGKKQEVEINLATSTKVRVRQQSEFDDKGNRKKSAAVVTAGTADDIRGGMNVTVMISGTRDGKWLVAKLVTVSGE